MKRLLILWITIASFAFILYLTGCGGPATNSNTNVNVPAKSDAPTPKPGPTMDDLCKATPKPDPDVIRAAIVQKIAEDDILKYYYNPDDPNKKNLIKFKIKPDDPGYKMRLEGSMSFMALLELPKVLETYTADTCVRRIQFVLKGTSDLKDNDPDAARTDYSFEWDIACQDPSHPCPGGICKDANEACKERPMGNTNRNANSNGNANANKNANINVNTNK